MRYNGGTMSVIATGASITTGAASASATIPNDSSGEVARYVRVTATVAAHVRIGVSAATAVATDLLVMPSDAVILHIPRGYTKIAAIQNAAAGVVIVTPLENE
jgi:hypothetical protein